MKKSVILIENTIFWCPKKNIIPRESS